MVYFYHQSVQTILSLFSFFQTILFLISFHYFSPPKSLLSYRLSMTDTLMYLQFVLNVFESLKNMQCCWMSQLFNTLILKNSFSSLVSFPDSNSHFIELALLHFLLSVSFTSMQAVLSRMFLSPVALCCTFFAFRIEAFI